MVSSFNSTEDLVQAIQASSHIPLVSDVRPTYSYRGQQYVDGGVAQFLPCPPGVAYCLRVSVLPAGSSFAAPGLGRMEVGELTDIDPLKFGTGRCGLRVGLLLDGVSPHWLQHTCRWLCARAAGQDRTVLR